jgi:glyoxylase-like metal-dependent hydrolase (beta-lactamase superfamily II)
MAPEVDAFYDKLTSTVSYVVHGGPGTDCAVIDPVLDFDAKSGRTKTVSADHISAFLTDRGLRLAWILETHVHADHVTAAPLLKRRHGGSIGIGEGVVAVQRHFAGVFGAEPEFATDGSQFDHLFADGERLAVGELTVRVLATPGHTPDSVSYLVGDALFVGDTLFMPDGGTARCDFPGGDARTLYRSIRRLLDLPPETRIFVCHDYQPGGRDIGFETSVAAQRAANIHLRGGADEEAFVTMRTARDRTLDVPALLIPAVQINMRAGIPPPPDPNGVSYLKVPLDLL